MPANFGGDAGGEGFPGVAEGGEEAGVGRVGAVGVHVAVGVEALETGADVVERGVRQLKG